MFIINAILRRKSLVSMCLGTRFKYLQSIAIQYCLIKSFL
jgi:hypothetical protein